MASDGLGVIALISGGKDSFYSLLHCVQHGHRIVALANLCPAAEGASSDVQTDLNSFMYQTVGHEIIPLYAAATGLPLYRLAITGSAVHHERDYACNVDGDASDEAESMTTLLRAVMEHHPEAKAVSAGAILSTYQRTRVESVALRLGLTPLAYLWQYPVLPPPVKPADDAQLLKDMAEAGLDARIIKVASAGLGEDHLWEQVSSVGGAEGIKGALRKFGAAGGAVLGEGGEFETLVLSGPSALFNKAIHVPEESRSIVREGGGSTWLLLKDARVVDRSAAADESPPRQPDLLDLKFENILSSLTTGHSDAQHSPPVDGGKSWDALQKASFKVTGVNELLQWAVTKSAGKSPDMSIEEETADVVEQIGQLLSQNSLSPEHISNTVIVLRHMADFPKVNAHYGKLFRRPNPPSRVTISCGELLPAGCSIAIYLTVDARPEEGASRHGLHVQSRSYWAPANIGPYSQAIGISAGGIPLLRTWSVAGQIPLLPASMELPPSSPTSRQLQVVLSLQHLWRIGTELKIQYWTSAVAYFARCGTDGDMADNARMAGDAWWLAHGSPDGEEDAEDGPDPWDLKYNPQYMTLGDGSAQAKPVPLPDWEALPLRQQNEPAGAVPPVFSVEVEELPRQSSVEWHAHIGLSGLATSSLEMLHVARVGETPWSAWHAVVRSAEGALLHTVLARQSVGDGSGDIANTTEDMNAAYRGLLGALGLSTDSTSSKVPYLVYANAEVPTLPAAMAAPTIPCRSIWSSTGHRLEMVGLYRVNLGV
ncbi:uncharacterized protein F5Z01DRAFT_616918 [Emericellopsis atlantica]|uniref:Diphthine--ammonia ligase n=1 Tax=Emericellopsis atlantica TaxID=2614577 RepID=A0A9P8CS48_9HYPO|nr:uncharacterized protein F5Z01DRAFT_616918 [Emericellopsis atlantica]KAG9257007.1 hypothetical protein F5Z01DRAFT_616918 [Emericellopsis atlantica]